MTALSEGMYGGMMNTMRLRFILITLFLVNFSATTAVFSEEAAEKPAKKSRYEYPPDMYTLGLQALKEQKYEEAATILEDVVKGDPVFLSGYICLANAYKNLNEPEKVIETYQKGIRVLLKQKKLAGVDLSGDASILSARLAEEYTVLGKKDEALAAANKAIELSPRDPIDYMTLGRVYKNFGEKDKARQSYETALTLARAIDSKILIARIEKIISEN